MKKIGSGYMAFVHNIADEAAEEHRQLRAVNKELLEALESALKTAEFERHPSRPWHQLAKDAIAHAKAKGQGGE